MPGAETRASAPGEVFSLADKMGGRWGSQGWEEAVRQRVEGEVGERDGRWGEGFSMKRPGINLRAAAGVSSGHLCSSLGLPPSAVCPVGCRPALCRTLPPPPRCPSSHRALRCLTLSFRSPELLPHLLIPSAKPTTPSSSSGECFVETGGGERWRFWRGSWLVTEAAPTSQ